MNKHSSSAAPLCPISVRRRVKRSSTGFLDQVSQDSFALPSDRSENSRSKPTLPSADTPVPKLGGNTVSDSVRRIRIHHVTCRFPSVRFCPKARPILSTQLPLPRRGSGQRGAAGRGGCDQPGTWAAAGRSSRSGGASVVQLCDQTATAGMGIRPVTNSAKPKLNHEICCAATYFMIKLSNTKFLSG